MKSKKKTTLLLSVILAAALLLGGCGSSISNEDATALTCDEQEFTIGFLNFMAHYTQASYDSMLVYYYGTDYWTDESFADSDGRTMEESVKEDVLDGVKEYYVLDQHRADYGVEVTDEEMDTMQAAGDEFMEENDRSAIRAMGASADYVAQMLYYETVANRMQEAIKAEVGEDLDIADYARRTFSYIQMDAVGDYDEDGNYVEYTEEELGDLLTQAELMAELAIGDFDGVAEEYDYSVHTYSYGEDEESEEDGGFSELVIQEADRLSEGEVSGVIDSGDYFYIIRLDSEDDEDAAESAMTSAANTIKSDHLSDVVDGYLEETEFTLDEELWDKVQFTKIFEINNTEE